MNWHEASRKALRLLASGRSGAERPGGTGCRITIPRSTIRLTNIGSAAPTRHTPRRQSTPPAIEQACQPKAPLPSCLASALDDAERSRWHVCSTSSRMPRSPAAQFGGLVSAQDACAQSARCWTSLRASVLPILLVIAGWFVGSTLRWAHPRARREFCWRTRSFRPALFTVPVGTDNSCCYSRSLSAIDIP